MSKIIVYKGYEIKLEEDNDSCNNPRDWDNLGIIVCWHSRYKIGDEQPSQSPAQYKEQLVRDVCTDEELDKLNAPRETVFLSRDRGTGRPTKKERRDMDSLLDTFFDLSDEDLN